MKITEDIFDAYLKCPTKCFFVATGETQSENTYTEWVKAKSESYRSNRIKHIVEEQKSGECIHGQLTTKNVKAAKWRFALNLFARSKDLESTIRVVERIHSKGRGLPTQFVPVRFIFSNKISKHDRLMLAFDAIVLSEALGRKTNRGKIIHGDTFTIRKIQLATLIGETRKLIGKITVLLANNSAPDIILNRHCVECGYQKRCRAQAIEKDDLSLLARMTEKDRKRFNGKGIFTVTQLSYTFRPRRRQKGSADKIEKYHHSLKARAIRENKIHIVGHSELRPAGTAVYLDVESLPDKDFFYLIGIRFHAEGKVVQHNYWADTIEDEKRIWEDFLDTLSQIESPTLFHYGSFETKFFKKMSNRYDRPSENSNVGKIIESSVNLLSIIYAQIYFPTFTNGLKEIAQHIGFQWSDTQASGIQSIAWRNEWAASKASSIKKALITYNSQDCEALELVTNKVVELQYHLANVDPSLQVGFVHTDKIKKEHLYGFGRTTFALPELDEINKAAYWDYQRDRVYIKTNSRLKRSMKSTSATRKHIPPNKTIMCHPPSFCKECNSTKLYKHAKASKIVFDLKFMTHGIKRWIICYKTHRYRCVSCEATFISWPGITGKYGSDLVAYALYQNIELRLPHRTIDRSLNRLFCLQLGIGTTCHFKTNAGKAYTETYDLLINKLVRGQLIHADETKASVRGIGGFVWVFTSMEEVVYLYSATREGEVPHSFLKEFKGVLVSDFYAAYDGIECPQQKCLIHLARDMNDSLLMYPYDEDIKMLTKDFSSVLKSILKTVDRYGLKTHFLRKHLVLVDRFYNRIAKANFQSEEAVKLRQRFDKNREKLFTFLKYDGVPWNNNNAEHAVKPFAMLRNIIGGITSENGLRDFLVLLSICQTCKYQGLDFLDFLRSGDKDISEYADSKRRRGFNKPNIF